MRREARYSHDDLKNLFLDVEKKIGRTPRGDEFTSTGLPDVGYYKRAFGTYGNFLRMMGRDYKNKLYRKKENPKRFFYPQEWLRVMNSVENDYHKFWLELLLHTGARINEVRNIKVENINFDKEQIFIAKPKGGRGKERTIQISTYLRNRIVNFVKKNKLKDTDYIMVRENGKQVTTQFITGADPKNNKYGLIKMACKKAGINDWRDFSAHNIRKTTEMWLVALNINHLAIVAHIGHSTDVASNFYVSTQLFTSEDKSLIKTILGNLLQKDGL